MLRSYETGYLACSLYSSSRVWATPLLCSLSRESHIILKLCSVEGGYGKTRDEDLSLYLVAFSPWSPGLTSGLIVHLRGQCISCFILVRTQARVFSGLWSQSSDPGVPVCRR